MMRNILSTLTILSSLYAFGATACNPPVRNSFTSIDLFLYRYRVGDVVTYSCSPGYEMTGGSRRRACLPYSIWSGTPLTCQRRSRNPAGGCRRPRNPPNGEVHSYPNTKQRFSPDELIQYQCNEGYVISARSSSFVRCTGSSWSHVPVCEEASPIPSPKEPRTTRRTTPQTKPTNPPRVVCNRRSPPANGAYSRQQQTKLIWYEGDVASFICVTNYELVGSRTSQCRSDGRWSSAVPTCRRRRVTCENRPPPPNGDYARDQEGKTVWYAGDVARYICSDGYRRRGSNPRCQSNGRWSADVPSCQRRVTCDNRPPPPNGDYARDQEGKTVWYAGDVARYICSDGYRRRGSNPRCQSNGRWSADVPSCQPPPRNPAGSCRRPRNPPNGEVHSYPNTKQRFSPDELIQYQCNEGYVISARSSSLVRCTGSSWSHVPVCEEASPSPTPKEPRTTPKTRPTRQPRTRATTPQTKPTRAPRVVCNRRSPPANGAYSRQQQTKLTWYEGDVASFICVTNYELVGSRTSQCRSDGRWSSAVPTCRRRRVTCENRPPPPNGDYARDQKGKTVWYAVDVARYICSDGYRRRGSNPRCQSNGRWSADVPSCQPETPSNPLCERPVDPQNGYIESTPSRKRSFGEGEYVMYICNDNFRVDGDGRVGCFGGRWSYVPECRALVTCPYRSAPSNGFYVSNADKSVWYAGDTAQYECDEGYSLVGNNHVSCQSNGVWSASLPVCQGIEDSRDVTPPGGVEEPENPDTHSDVTCPHQPAPANGVYIQDIGKTVWRPGDIARYRCNPNYVLIGHDYTNCRNDGTWRFSVPTCQNGCDRPPNPEAGTVFSTPPDKRMFMAGDTIAFRCNDGYRLVGESRVHCQNNGWAALPSCDFQVTCPHREAPENGIYIQDEEKRQWFVGDIARYRCDQGYVMDGHSYIDCLADGTWRFHVPTCLRSDSTFSTEPVEPHTEPTRRTTPRAPTPSPRIPTEPVYCRLPRNPSNGRVGASPRSRRRFENGDHVTYSCNAGYGLVGGSRVVCRRGEWSHVPTCTRSGCTRPDTPESGRIRPLNRRFFSDGDFVTYSCNDNYGLAGDAKVYCRNTRWSHQPFCRRACPSRNPSANGRYVNFQGRWFAGDVAIVGCAEGYNLVGEARSTCQMDGTWQYNVPSCRRAEDTQGSCRGSCSEVDVGGCTCDSSCMKYNDCCHDYKDQCGGKGQQGYYTR